MNLKLDMGPLSNNKAWKGRHFKTREYKQFESDIIKILPPSREVRSKSEVFVHYVYHLKSYGLSDTANMEKTLTDMLVKRGYLLDDRYIRAIYQRKERLGEGEREWINIQIEDYTGQDTENP
jgi:Holliday junction resolvase RusA-like endonuclease